MKLGEKISESRKKRGLSLMALGDKVGLSGAHISDIENSQLKKLPDPNLVLKIADALQDNSVLLCYLDENPVYKAIIPRIFPDLNNIKRDPAIIFSRFADEAEEARDAARGLSQMFANAEPERLPGYREFFFTNLEQVVDVQRCAELLFLQLIVAGVMTEEDRREVHRLQQAKCEERGHHRPEKEEAAA